MIEKHDLSCCAMCNFTANNRTTLEEITSSIDRLKREAFMHEWECNDRRSGQRTAFTIVSPGEYILEENLITAGFELITTFNRRFGYPEGILKMYMYKF